MILYLIQVHKDVDQIFALLDQIYDPANTYLVNTDPEFQCFELKERFIKAELGNIIVRTGTPVEWGGISQVYALVDAMKYALNLNRSWQFLINLSGDTIALASQSRIRDFYAEAAQKGQRAHLTYFGKGSQLVGSHAFQLGGDVGFEVGSEHLDLYGRVPAVVDRTLLEMFRDRAQSPLFRWRARGSIHVTDLLIEKKLVIRPLLPHEARHRSERFAEWPMYGGRAWFSFTRDAVEDILSDPFFDEITHEFEHFFCPDEMLFHTYLSHSPRFSPEMMGQDNKRFRRGDATRIHDGMVDELFASGAFFARKALVRECPMIRARFEGLRQVDKILQSSG